MDENLKTEITAGVMGDGFAKLSQSLRYSGTRSKRSVRRIMLRDEVSYQVEEIRDGKTRVTNLTPEDMEKFLEKIFDAPGTWEIHLMTASGDLHVRMTRKRRVLISRSKPMQREVKAPENHDRQKGHPLNAFDSRALLHVTGIADADGSIRASMRPKYDQVNAFLREIDAVTEGLAPGSPLVLADMGCGLAYLLFAAHGYLTHVRGLQVQARGIDRNTDVVKRAGAMATALGVADEVKFICADVADAQPDVAPDLVVSLHACDTATDEALARAVEWKSKRILCAPCCQHELHARLGKEGRCGAMRGVLRHGILRERLGDLLTDTFRAQILRILGYRVRVVEFVGPDATARNIMLRAESQLRPGNGEAIDEYLELRDFWGVRPWLEQRLARELAKYPISNTEYPTEEVKG